MGGIAAAQPGRREMKRRCVRERKMWIKAKIVKVKHVMEACDKVGVHHDEAMLIVVCIIRST